MITRIILTVLAMLGGGLIHTIYNPVATIILGQTAGDQFTANNMVAVRAAATISGFQHIDALLSIGGFAIFLLIWWAPLMRLVTVVKEEATKTDLLLAALLIGGLLLPTPSKAFYEVTEKTEAYTILPNWTAFWIPDTGDNITDQATLDSSAYLEKKKVATKRFIVPHAKLTGTGGWGGWDAYVPTGRLILVDRTTYSHEWVDSTDRGSSTKKEGFPCQTNEGLNITAGVSVGARVDEGKAATFLYNFGVNAPKSQNMQDPQEIFRSVYYGKSLTEVMQDMGRKKIQTLVCNEIGKRGFDSANKEMVIMMDAIEKKTREYFDAVGISITFIGWADTFTFDHNIQLAVNSSYETTIQASNYAKLMPYADLLKTFATADAVKKFNGALPSTYVGQLPDWISGLIASPTAKPWTAPAATPTGAK